jgi:alpha-amylase
LTHPGIPCVFWDHHFARDEGTRGRISALLKLRRDQGLHACSVAHIAEAGPGGYA